MLNASDPLSNPLRKLFQTTVSFRSALGDVLRSTSLQFHNANEAQFIGMVALSVILFSGGMDTKYKDIRPVLSPGIVLSTVGVLLTAIFTGLFIWWLSGMSWTNIALPFTTSLLLASTMSSTDSASVFAILRSQKMHLKHNLRPMLELESGSNDPMAYMLTIVLIQIINSAGMSFASILGMFVVQFLIGIVFGYLLGRLAVIILNRLNIDNQALYPILLLAFVFFTFSITDLAYGNGYLAVYICGMIVGNSKIAHRKDTITFIDGLTWLFQIIMFLCLGLLVNPHEMLEVAAVALLIGIFMIVIGRPLSVMLCLLPFKNINMRSRLFVSWVGLRGAVPITARREKRPRCAGKADRRVCRPPRRTGTAHGTAAAPSYRSRRRSTR